MASSHWLRIRAKVNATGLFISHHNALNYEMFSSRVTNITISDFVSVGGDCVKTNGRMLVLKIALFRMKTKHFYISLGSWWRHQMETFFALLAICAEIHWSPVNSPQKGQWRGALMFSLIWIWINVWVNNGEAGDLRRHRAHYDVIVMGPVDTATPKNRWIFSVEFVWCSLIRISNVSNRNTFWAHNRFHYSIITVFLTYDSRKSNLYNAKYSGKIVENYP